MNRTKSVVLVVLASLFLVGFAAFAADATELTSWQTAVATAVATVIGVPVVQLIKVRWLKDDASSLLLRGVAYGVSFVLSIGVLGVTGGLSDVVSNWTSIFAQGSIVFTLMTFVYTVLAEKLNLGK